MGSNEQCGIGLVGIGKIASRVGLVGELSSLTHRLRTAGCVQVLVLLSLAGCLCNCGTSNVVAGPPTLASIALTPGNASIAAGTTKQFTATGTYSNGSTQNLTSAATWKSSVPGVATISAAGLATTAAKGASSISATMGSITGSTTLTVTAPTLVSIAVTPGNPSIAAGTMQQFTATGTYSDGSTQNLTSAATWSSSASGVATISAAGLA
ncbi:MAG: Ig-like domain-containing protein, partial [Candidatus Sulfotelmatobacter sp.]